MLLATALTCVLLLSRRVLDIFRLGCAIFLSLYYCDSIKSYLSFFNFFNADHL
jgi:hypothetical protein